MDEPMELDEFLHIIQETFQGASAVYLEDFNAFRPFPCVALLKLADRFDEVAIPLLTAGLTTSWGLARTLRQHLPIHIQKTTLLSTTAVWTLSPLCSKDASSGPGTRPTAGERRSSYRASPRCTPPSTLGRALGTPSSPRPARHPVTSDGCPLPNTRSRHQCGRVVLCLECE